MNLVEGARYSEAADGTNGIGTALAADHAFQVFAFEHFNERHHQWICSGAPVHDPVSGRTIGLIDLSSLWKIAHPRSLELVTTAARTIEQCLLEARRDQDARLRRRYGDLMTRSTDLLVDRDGYVLAGAEREHSKPLDVPEGGGEVVLGDGSVAVAASLGQGEAYLLRRVTTRHARSAPVEGSSVLRSTSASSSPNRRALRQVATLVARESAPDQLFAAVAEQVARVFDVPHVRLVRYEPEGSVVVGGFSEGEDGPFPIGSHWPLDSPGVIATVRETGRPARVEDYAHLTGEIAAVVRGAGMRSAVASPIVVESVCGEPWWFSAPRHEPLPADTEARLTDFTELVATAIANAESRDALARLADEQAALRRVATLVASGGGPGPDLPCRGRRGAGAVRLQHFGHREVRGRRDGDDARNSRRPPYPRNTPTESIRISSWAPFAGRDVRRGSTTDDPTAASMPAIVRETGVRSAVASPIVVEGECGGRLASDRSFVPFRRTPRRRLARLHRARRDSNREHRGARRAARARRRAGGAAPRGDPRCARRSARKDLLGGERRGGSAVRLRPRRP